MFKKLIYLYAKKYAENKAFRKEIDIIKYGEKGKPRITMGKKLTIFLLANFVLIELYSLIMMYIYEDLGNLSTLISSVIGETITLLAYFAKSTIENRVGGITYETAMRDIDKNNNSVG